MARESSNSNVGAPDTPNLRLKLTNDVDAITTTFKQWRECINGEIGSNMQKIDTFAGNTNEALNNKVDKETGKGLSTNDFTDNDKTKIDAIPANPKYTDTTYTAGEGIAISDTNVISAALDIDTTVTQNSGNLITSGAVYSYIQSLDGNGVKY